LSTANIGMDDYTTRRLKAKQIWFRLKSRDILSEQARSTITVPAGFNIFVCLCDCIHRGRPTETSPNLGAHRSCRRLRTCTFAYVCNFGSFVRIRIVVFRWGYYIFRSCVELAWGLRVALHWIQLLPKNYMALVINRRALTTDCIWSLTRRTYVK
jgi:hypothetical protein